MKIQVTMKDPDGVYESLIELLDGNADAEWIKSHFEYGEYLTVEFDTEARTVVVVMP